MASLKRRGVENRSRLAHPKMAAYRRVYRRSSEYRGGNLEGQTVIVYCEQGHGDIIQFARYVPDLMSRGCRVILHCPVPLHRLLSSSGIGHEWLDRDASKLPPHDFHIPMMSLPFLGFREESIPYLKVDPRDVFSEDVDSFRVGVAWEGNPEHSNNLLRSCSLSSFGGIASLPGASLYMLQAGVNLPSLSSGVDFPLYSTPREDFYDTACLVAGMDMIVSVDTSVLHLAGAMGMPATYGLISDPGDHRWIVRDWYPGMTLLRDHGSNWKKGFGLLEIIAANRGMVQVSSVAAPSYGRSILITGGIGDFLALDSHLGPAGRASISRIYLASRANAAIGELIAMLGMRAEVLNIMADYRDKTFYHKGEVSRHLIDIGCPFPGDWSQVEDWSILIKFPDVQSGSHAYFGSGLLEVDVEPGDYVLICPETDTDPGRRLESRDWEEIVTYLERTGMRGVVIAGVPAECPDHPLLDDMSGKTSLAESLELLRRASGYVGIDSFLSILAAQRLAPGRIRIKSRNDHLYRHRDVYYASHREWSFIGSSIDLAGFCDNQHSR